MGKTHKEQRILVQELKEAKSKVVIYQAQYGEQLIFLRPLSVWLENVEWEGNLVPRFSKL